MLNRAGARNDQSLAGLWTPPFALLLAGLSGWAGGLADAMARATADHRSLTDLGFLLMAFVGLTDGPSDYWKTFLPGV